MFRYPSARGGRCDGAVGGDPRRPDDHARVKPPVPGVDPVVSRHLVAEHSSHGSAPALGWGQGWTNVGAIRGVRWSRRISSHWRRSVLEVPAAEACSRRGQANQLARKAFSPGRLFRPAFWSPEKVYERGGRCSDLVDCVRSLGGPEQRGICPATGRGLAVRPKRRPGGGAGAGAGAGRPESSGRGRGCGPGSRPGPCARPVFGHPDRAGCRVSPSWRVSARRWHPRHAATGGGGQGDERQRGPCWPER